MNAIGLLIMVVVVDSGLLMMGFALGLDELPARKRWRYYIGAALVAAIVVTR